MAENGLDGDAGEEAVPYHHYAFHNVYNYAAMGGMFAASVLTQNWVLALFGAGFEALWMVFGPDSRLLRRLWFDKVHAAALHLDG